MSDESDLVSRHAVMAQTAYLPKGKRQDFVDKYYNGEYSYIPEYSDSIHAVYKNKSSGNITMSTRGSDISNTHGGRVKDLATDVLVTLGIENLSNRYKRSERLLNKIRNDNPDTKMTLASHSLGSSINSNLSWKYDIDSYGFNAGASPLSAVAHKHKVLHPKNKEKKQRNKIYLTIPSVEKGGDLLSLSNVINPTANIKFVEQKELSKKDKGVLGAHSLKHFFPKKAII